MSEIKTQIIRSDMKISSQNTAVKNYSEQLNSSVLSDRGRKEILRKMQSELTAQQFQRPEIRSAENTVKVHTESVLQTSVNNDIIHTQRNSEYIKSAKISYSEDVKTVIAASENLEEKIQAADKLFRKKAILRNMRIKQMRLKNKRYTIAKSDDDNLLSESAEFMRYSADTVIQAGEAV